MREEDTDMADKLTDAARALIDAPNFATMATIQPDGRPQLSVVWLKTDGDDVLVSTVKGRRKHLNIVADPRVTLLVYPASDPYRYVEVRGTATLEDAGAPELIQELSHRYDGKPFREGNPDNERVIVRIAPDRIVTRG
ncbi:PPOX class F420-dependent oxidoreductase [Yinghuangia seranimata]|uniref:PPOX class F420-dependent oxidoreductase n=1 Tax=Yinghuangia seranimata TaxID=408067 RepID=UPI00248AC678|nr:PPOX class F420-dependent oxidoreductase [Yinghuangia seranimata]MDI2131781.1 PPOX class F420-dependent oxidoreductase [Yinghuangia seranimata]